MVKPITPSPAQNEKYAVREKLTKQGDFDPFELTRLLATDSDRTNTGGR